MTTTHVEGLDKSIHKTNVWLEELQSELGWSERGRTYLALRTGLHVIRDRLLPEEAADLASHLPTLIRGVYYDGYRPAHKPRKIRTRDEFVAPMREAFSMDPDLDAEATLSAVFTLLDRHVPEGEMRHVLESLPQDLRQMVEPAHA